MIARPTRVVDGRGQTILAARLEFERGGAFELRFGVPEEFGERVDPSTNPFVPLASLLAAHLGEDLTLEAPVSPLLLAGAREAVAIFERWWGYRPPAVRAEGGVEPATPGLDGVAALYSRGVDTTATVIRSLRGEIPERVTHLLAGDGIEWCFSRAVEERIWADNERAAADLGLPLIRLTSNARDLLRGLIGWPRAFGATYVGAALALGPMHSHLLTGATQPRVGGEPRGSRWDLDPLWSTEATTVRQDAAELDRVARVAIVAAHEPSVRWLKVCWEGRGAGNCGRCLKCLRTMTALAAAGVLDRAALFEAPLTPAAVRAAPLGDKMPPLTVATVEAVPQELPELRQAWEEKRREWLRLRRRLERDRNRAERARRLRRKRRRLARRVRALPNRTARAVRRGRRRLRHRLRRALVRD